MRDVALVILVLSAAMVAFRKPVYGMLIFVAFGIVNPQSFTWGFGRTFPLAQITALATIAGYFLSSEPKRFPNQRETWMLLGLWLFYCISTADAIFPDRGWISKEALDRLKYVSKILLMIGLSMSILYTKERIQLLMKVIALCIGLFALKGGLWSLLTGFQYIVWGPPGTFLHANNSIGLAMAMNVPLLFYLIKVESNTWIRRIMWAMLIFSVPAILGTFSRGAWLGLAAATGLILLKSQYKILIAMAGLIFVLLFLPLLTLDVLPERIQSRFDQLINYEEEASAESRFWNWELCWRVGLANPLTGEGFNYYQKSMYQKFFPEFQDRWGYEVVWACHSMWFTIWGEHGIPAFLLWIILLTSCFLSLRKVQRFSRMNKDLVWLEHYAWMIQISLVVYCIVGTFLDIAYFDVFYYLVGVVILLKEHMYQVVRSWHLKERETGTMLKSRRQSLVGVV